MAFPGPKHLPLSCQSCEVCASARVTPIGKSEVSRHRLGLPRFLVQSSEPPDTSNRG